MSDSSRTDVTALGRAAATGQEPRGGSGIEYFVADLGRTPAERRARWGEALLVRFGAAGRRAGDPGAGLRGAGLVSLISSVWPVRSTGRSYFPHVSVGRTGNNDVVLDHPSVSRFHAFFRREGEVYVLVDAGSSNGTQVNERGVPRSGQGPPAVVTANARLRFGDVELVYLLAEDFWNLVRAPSATR